MTYTSTRRGVCKTCKHNQELPVPADCPEKTLFDECGFGTCRARPPVACMAPGIGEITAEPIFPLTVDQGPLVQITGQNGCGGWEQKAPLVQAERLITSPELITDGDFNDGALANWIQSDCTKSKKPATPRSGTCARLTYLATTTGNIGQNFPVYFPFRFSAYRLKGFARGDGIANPRIELYNQAPPGILTTNVLWIGTTDPTWQAFNVGFAVQPNAQASLWATIKLIGNNLATGRYVEFDAISFVQYQETHGGINCWSCRHFQAYSTTRQGECRRALPEALCVDTTLTDQPGHEQEPLWPKIIDSDATWCSAWQQSADPVAPLPAIVWEPLNIPPVYNYPRQV